jgi:site-specific DNA recombinase
MTRATADSTVRAILYARESDPYGDRKERRHSEAGASIETSLKQQIAEEMELAKSLGATVLAEDTHVERYTGVDSIFDRPEISSIREKIKTGLYRYLICYDTDRLARDPIHTGLIMQECMNFNCELQFVKMPLENTDTGVVLLFVRGIGDKLEAAKFKDRSRRGRKAIISGGRIPTAGKPLYGYKFDKAKHVRVVEEPEAKNVRLMFRWSRGGLSARSIAERLNASGVPSPAANSGRHYRDDKRAAPKWGTTQIQRILKREEYTGITYYDKHRMTDRRRAKSGKYESELKPQSEWVKLESDVIVTPQIVSEGLFKEVQTQLRARARGHNEADGRRNSLVPALLRGLIHCSECGLKMYPMSETRHYKGGRKEKLRVYRCSARLGARLAEDTECSGGRVMAEEVENKVWDKLLSFFRLPEVIEAEVQRIIENWPSDTIADDLKSVQADKEKQRRLYEKFYAKYTAALSADDDMLAERLEANCRALSDEIKALEGVAEQLDAKLAAKERTKEITQQFAQYCRKMDRAFETVSFPFEKKKETLTALRVTVLAHSNGTLKLHTNLGAILQISPEIKSLVLTRTGIAAGRRRRSDGCSRGRPCVRCGR